MRVSAPEQPSRRRWIRGRGILLLVVLAVALASVAGPARAYWRQRSELIAVRTDIAARQADAAELRHDVARWNDPAYVKAQARSRLHLVMPGETGYVVVRAPRPSPTAAPSASGTAVPSPGGLAASPSASALAGVSGAGRLASASPAPTASASR